MGQSHAVSALVAQRAKIAGLILDLEKQLANHRASLLHIDATLKLLDPAIKIHKIRARHRAADRSSYFDRGEISRRCKEAIRDSGPDGVSTDDVVSVALRDKGMEGDAEMRRDFFGRFYWAMLRLERDGQVDRFGFGRAKRWRVRSGG
jgi:hypothetical protein